MTLVYTARYPYRGSDRLDITRKGAAEFHKTHPNTRAPGIAFAPSNKLLWPYIAKRKEQHGKLTQAQWEEYRMKFLVEMEHSRQRYATSWQEILTREHVTLVCFCFDHKQCHRSIVAEILESQGAIYRGER